MELCIIRPFTNLPHKILFFTQNHTHLQWRKTSFPLNHTAISRTNKGLRYYPNSYLKSLNSTTSEETSTVASEVKEEPDGVVSVVDVQSVEKNDYKETESDKEDSLVDGQTNPFEFLDNLNLKLAGIPPHRVQKFLMKRRHEVDPERLPEQPICHLLLLFHVIQLNWSHDLLDVDPERLTEQYNFIIICVLSLDFENDSYLILLYGGGSLLALWLVAAVVGAIESIPVFPKLLEIVGLSYTLWFTTRYLLFKKNRDELFAKIEEIKEEVIGSGDD